MVMKKVVQTRADEVHLQSRSWTCIYQQQEYIWLVWECVLGPQRWNCFPQQTLDQRHRTLWLLLLSV